MIRIRHWLSAYWEVIDWKIRKLVSQLYECQMISRVAMVQIAINITRRAHRLPVSPFFKQRISFLISRVFWYISRFYIKFWRCVIVVIRGMFTTQWRRFILLWLYSIAKPAIALGRSKLVELLTDALHIEWPSEKFDKLINGHVNQLLESSLAVLPSEILN